MQDPFAQYAVKDDPFAAYAVDDDWRPSTPTALDMLTGRGISSDTSDSPDRWTGLHQMLESAAHPQTWGDVATLLAAPVDATRGVAGKVLAQIPARTIANKTLKGAAAVLDSPIINATVSPRAQHLGRMANALADTIGTTASHAASETARATQAAQLAAEAQIARGAEQYTMPRVDRVVERVPKAAQAFGEAPPAKILRGQLRKVPTPSEPAPPAAPPAVTGPNPTPPPPLQTPRVEIGAEQAGRQAGLSKEEVRAATEPILGEAPGAASPILPEGALKRIIDTLKAMPPGSAEREAYVARATSGKTQWQIENIRRTLEHLGLLVPAAVITGATLRDAIMRRLSGPRRSRRHCSPSVSSPVRPRGNISCAVRSCSGSRRYTKPAHGCRTRRTGRA
jgi:hypothetical protein